MRSWVVLGVEAIGCVGIVALYVYRRKIFSGFDDYGSERQQAEWGERLNETQHASNQRGGSAQLVPLSTRTHKSVLDLKMVSRLMVGKYANIYRGHVLLKDAISLHLYGILMQREKPKTIFDLGSARLEIELTTSAWRTYKRPAHVCEAGSSCAAAGGGSAVWFATQAKAMGLECKVVTVDIADYRTEACRKEMTQLGIEFLQADLRDSSAMLSAIGGKAQYPRS